MHLYNIMSTTILSVYTHSAANLHWVKAECKWSFLLSWQVPLPLVHTEGTVLLPNRNTTADSARQSQLSLGMVQLPLVGQSHMTTEHTHVQ